MSKVTKILNNSVEKTLKDLAKDARDGRLTYFHMLAQYEDEEYVIWSRVESGEKSYDPQHLLAEIGQYNVLTQNIFLEICEQTEGEDDEGID